MSAAAPPFELAAARLRLRRFAQRDLAAHLALRGDPPTRRFQSFPRRYGAPQALAFFAAMRRRLPDDGRGWFNLCIAALDSDAALGDLGVNRQGERAFLGISLAREARGRGYATEALECIVPWLAARGVARLRAEIDARNEKSVALFHDRLGFAPLGSWKDGAVEVLVFERAAALSRSDRA